MTKCEDFERLISDSLDRSSTDIERVELEAHLQTCNSCRQFHAALLAGRQLLKDLPQIAHDRPAPCIDQPRSKNLFARVWHARLTVPLPVAAGIGLLILSLAAFSAFRRTEPTQVIEPAPSSTIDYVQVEVVPASAAKPLPPESHINKR